MFFYCKMMLPANFRRLFLCFAVPSVINNRQKMHLEYTDDNLFL